MIGFLYELQIYIRLGYLPLFDTLISIKKRPPLQKAAFKQRLYARSAIQSAVLLAIKEIDYQTKCHPSEGHFEGLFIEANNHGSTNDGT